MKKVKILSNQNKLFNEVTNNAKYSNQSNEFSIRLVFNGFEQYNVGHKQLNIYPGNFLIINNGTIFDREIYSEVPVESFSVSYTDQFLASFHHSIISSDSELLDDPFFENSTFAPLFLETIYPFKGDMMFNLLHLKNHFDNDSSSDLLMNEYLFHCLLNFYRLYKQEILAKSKRLDVLNNKTRIELFKRLNNAKDYMLSNYNQALSLKDISQYACLSETHFFRTFRQTYNCSPHQYLTMLRLNSARHMLHNTNYEVREIVNLVGFDNTSSFIRLFKDKFGITPGGFRLDIAA